MPAPRKHRVLSALWCRGFAPALVVLVVAIASLIFGAIYQQPAPPGSPPGALTGPFRFAFWPGVIVFANGDPPRTATTRPANMLGHMNNPGWWFFATKYGPGWTKRWTTGKNWLPYFYGWHTQIPLFPLAALLAILPSIAAWRRFRKVPLWACQKCRYDLRGAPGGVCPECGTVSSGIAGSRDASSPKG